jgi:hypothetical protein
MVGRTCLRFKSIDGGGFILVPVSAFDSPEKPIPIPRPRPKTYILCSGAPFAPSGWGHGGLFLKDIPRDDSCLPRFERTKRDETTGYDTIWSHRASENSRHRKCLSKKQSLRGGGLVPLLARDRWLGRGFLRYKLQKNMGAVNPTRRTTSLR